MASSRLLPIPDGVYTSVAWLDSTLLAFIFTETRDENTSTISLYNLETDTWSSIETADLVQCESNRVRLLNTLPNGNLGFISTCSSEEEGVINTQDTLYSWSQQSHSLQTLYRYPKNFGTTHYSFAPDMSEWFQEVRDEERLFILYWVKKGGQMMPFLNEYQRTGAPAWSPNGNTIVFGGNEEIPEKSDNPFMPLGGAANIVRFPWHLYTLEGGSSSPQVLLSDIKYLNFVKWSPQGRWLAFQGEYAGDHGIWVLDVIEKQLVRIWPTMAFYDWSPDGTRIIVVDGPYDVSASDTVAIQQKAHILDLRHFFKQ